MTMTRWFALGESTRTWSAVRRLDHADAPSAVPAVPTPASPAATAKAISPTAAAARTALATLSLIRPAPFFARARPPASAVSLRGEYP
jgi:hypothetical protein